MALCIEGDGAAPAAFPSGRSIAALGGRDVVFRDAPDDAPMLHGEAAELAPADAWFGFRGGPALLALAARDPQPARPAQGTQAAGVPRRCDGRRPRPLSD